MLGYLFVILALLMGATKGYCGKKTSAAIEAIPSAMLFNAVRMLICIPIGLAFVIFNTGSFAALRIDLNTLLISALSGLATSVFVVSWILAVRRGAYMMVDVFLTLGVIVPVCLCRFFFGEEVRVNQIVGIALLAMAAYIMCGYNNAVKAERMNFKSFALLIVCGVSNGLNSFAQKWFRYESASDASIFNFYTYVFSAAALLFCWLVSRSIAAGGGKTQQSPVRLRQLGVYVSVMSLCIFMHSFFSTMAAGYLTSSQLYPLMQGGGLTLSLFMSALFFQEKITPRCMAGIGITFGALLCINLL